MTTINSVGNGLSGATGSGNFVGANSPTLITPILGQAAATNISMGYATTVSSASPIVLVVGSPYQQYITGSTAQTVTMPVTSTLANVATNAQSWLIVNNSSNTTTVNSSGGNLIESLPAGSQAVFTCILNSGTTAASWASDFILNVAGVASITGTANQVIASAATGAVTLSLPQSIATTSNVTFGSVTFSPTTSGIVGTTTNDNAAAGKVGELVTSQVTFGSSNAFTSGNTVNITSISLTAGDWDVCGNAGLNSTTTVTSLNAGISTTSATLPDESLTTYILGIATASVIASPVPYQRLSLSGTTTVYLVATGTGSATMKSWGSISARRAR